MYERCINRQAEDKDEVKKFQPEFFITRSVLKCRTLVIHSNMNHQLLNFLYLYSPVSSVGRA